MNPTPKQLSTTRFVWKRRVAWSVGLVVAIALAFVAMDWVRPPTATPKKEELASKTLRPVTVTVGETAARSVHRVVNVVGTLYGYEEIVISSNVEGRIKRIAVDVGQRIAATQVLAEIDPTNFELAVRQSQKSLAVEYAKLGLEKIPTDDFDIKNLPIVREAYSRLQLASQNEVRIRDLNRSNSIAVQDLESAVSDLRTAEANFENQLLLARAAMANLKLQGETLAIVQQQLNDTVIRSPTPESTIPFANDQKVYAISSRNVSEGTFVRKGDEVFRLVIDSALRLRVAVPERFLASVQLDQPAEVTTAAYSDPMIGKVATINPVISTATRTYEVEILIDNSDHRLKPGGFAKASIITNQNDSAITVPLESLITFAGITKIFLIESEFAKEAHVKVGEQGLDWVEIVSPSLAAGAIIVTSGQTALADGMPVVVRSENSRSRDSNAQKTKVSQ